ENLAEHGLLDAVVPADGLAGYLDRVLAALTPAPGTAAGPAGEGGSAIARDAIGASSDEPGPDAWEAVLRTRESGRPGAADLIRAAATGVAPVRDGGGLLLALARIGGLPCVVAGQDRSAPSLTAAALRQARRGMRLAEQLRIPLVTVIDTPGAELS